MERGTNSAANRESYGQSIVASYNRLIGVHGELVRQKAQLIHQIDEYSKVLSQKDNVSKFLMKLKDNSESRLISNCESLLTSLIRDIKGSDPENAKVVIATSSRGSKPWLDIEVETDRGKRRDIALDKGASIKSLIGMGLRFIALGISRNRRLLVLDEADKELNPKYIPALSEILQKLSSEVGMQVLYITHKDRSNFNESCLKIHLERNKDLVELAEDLDDSNEAEVGLRYIRLTDFKQHKSTHIPLSPGVNVITGDIDIGKTTILEAIKAVARNAGRKGLVRDGAKQCSVELGLEGGNALKWSYRTDRSVRTEYAMYDESGILIEQHKGSSSAPEWVDGALAMPLINGLDMNFAGVNDSAFIVDQKVSGHDRAKFLSISGSSGKIDELMEKHNKLVIDTRKKHSIAKESLANVKARLEKISPIFEVEQHLERAEDFEGEINIASERCLCITSLGKGIGEAKKRSSALNYLPMAIDLNPEGHRLNLVVDLALEVKRHGDRLNALNGLPSEVSFSEVLGSNDASKAFDRCDRLRATLSALEKTPARIIEDTSMNGGSADTLSTKLIRLQENLSNSVKAVEEASAINQSEKSLICPRCKHEFHQ